MTTAFLALCAFLFGLFSGVALTCLGCAAARGERLEEAMREGLVLARSETLRGGSVNPLENTEGE